MTLPELFQPRTEAAFVTAPIRHGRDGTGPDLPDGVGFLELASPATDADFALYEIGREDLPRCTAATPVPVSLAGLLHRAEEHPPAMALMRDAVIHRVVTPPTRSLFLWRVERLLERYLRPEAQDRQVRARCVVDEVGYRSAGKTYWLVAYSPQERLVCWVSADFIVYTDPVEGFDVSTEALSRLPGAPPLWWPDESDQDCIPSD